MIKINESIIFEKDCFKPGQIWHDVKNNDVYRRNKENDDCNLLIDVEDKEDISPSAIAHKNGMEYCRKCHNIETPQNTLNLKIGVFNIDDKYIHKFEEDILMIYFEKLCYEQEFIFKCIFENSSFKQLSSRELLINGESFNVKKIERNFTEELKDIICFHLQKKITA